MEHSSRPGCHSQHFCIFFFFFLGGGSITPYMAKIMAAKVSIDINLLFCKYPDANLEFCTKLRPRIHVEIILLPLKTQSIKS